MVGPCKSQTTAPAQRAAPGPLGYAGFSLNQHDSIINEPGFGSFFGYMTRNSAGFSLLKISPDKRCLLVGAGQLHWFRS